jgi:acetyltransferase
MIPIFTPKSEGWSNLDPAQDIYQYTANPLKSIFAPKNVAVIGATEKEGSVGRTILWNLISSPFGGAVFPINPKRPSLLGIKAYSSIKNVPDQVDLAVIVTPSTGIPDLITECVEAGVKGAIVISAGFKEMDPKVWSWNDLCSKMPAKARCALWYPTVWAS